MDKLKKGDWFISYIGSIPSGISEVVEIDGLGTYSKAVVETVLPETEQEWAVEKEETLSNLRTLVQAKNMKNLLERVKQHAPSVLEAEITLTLRSVKRGQ